MKKIDMSFDIKIFPQSKIDSLRSDITRNAVEDSLELTEVHQRNVGCSPRMLKGSEANSEYMESSQMNQKISNDNEEPD